MRATTLVNFLLALSACSALPTLNSTAALRLPALVFSSRAAAALHLNGFPIATLPARGGSVTVSLISRLIPGSILTVQSLNGARAPHGVKVTGSALPAGKWHARCYRKAASALRKEEWKALFEYREGCSWKKVKAVGKGYWWAAGRCGKGMIMRGRFVVGGRKCGRKPQKKMAVVKVAVGQGGQAWIFVNGKHLMDVEGGKGMIGKRVRIGKGDVVAVKVMGGGVYGRVQVGRAVVSGWRWTRGLGGGNKEERLGWMQGGFRGDCGWGEGESSGEGEGWVWVGGKGGIVRGRIVVGGEGRCDGGKAGKVCRCREVGNEGGVCWYFKDTRKKSCGWRKCEAKYECGGNGELLCVKKVVNERIVFKEEIGGDKICRLVREGHFIYVPYSGNMVSYQSKHFRF